MSAEKSKTQIALENCPLFPWRGPGFCGGCNANLGRPSRRWCSDSCQDRFLSNHSWGHARVAALARDKVCVRCGRDGTVPDEVTIWWRFMRDVGRVNYFDRLFADWHRELLLREGPSRVGNWKKRHQLLRRRFAEETGIYNLDWIDGFNADLARYQRYFGLEVNHITPIRGKHAEYGCHHHLDGLEVLCGEHHLEETRRQRERGEFD